MLELELTEEQLAGIHGACGSSFEESGSYQSGYHSSNKWNDDDDDCDRPRRRHCDDDDNRGCLDIRIRSCGGGILPLRGLDI